MRAGLSIGWLLVLAILAASAEARSATPEYEVKAAFIYNFTKFVDWPDSEPEERSNLGLCILGDDPFGNSMDALAGREVQGRSIEIRYPETLGDARSCQVVYISRSEGSRVSEILSELGESRGILFVSDIPRFAEQGGTIELRVIDNKIRFAVNVAAADSGRIEISSRLLRLAVEVMDDGGGT